MRMNALMARSWTDITLHMEADELHKDLADLATSPLIEHMGAIVLQGLIAPGLGDPSPEDLTGFEAITNKIHVSDYVDADCRGTRLVAQGVKYAEALIRRLTGSGRQYRIIMNRDLGSGEVTVRFFVRRGGIPWGYDDPEEYSDEEVVQWDV